jgi:SM-20-related protein
MSHPSPTATISATDIPATSTPAADQPATTPAPHPVKTTILLTGGHQHELTLSSDAPLLHQLFGILFNQTQTQAPHSLLQIPINEGKSAIAFASQNLVGLLTDPPIFAQRPASESAPNQPQQFATPQTPGPSEAPQRQVYRYIQIENFFPPEFHQQLLDYAINSRDEYAETGPVTNNEHYKDHRNSLVIYYPRYAELFLDRVKQVMPRVMAHLDLPEFEVARIETQLTAHNDNNYYKIHNDNSSADTAARQLTYVYYFNREPKAYSGGNLEIYDTTMENGRAVAGQHSQIVEPKNNSIVFFPSYYLHEVRPVICPSRAFADSRFTMNGWIRQPES